MPTGGGMFSNTEYEIGGSRMAEAAHCILGSITKLHLSALSHPFWVEKDHIKEEMGLIERFQKEYSRDLYIDRLDLNDKYTQATIKSIKKAAPILIKKARSALPRIDNKLPIEIKRLAEYSYSFLIVLAKEMLKSVEMAEEDGKFTHNAYADLKVKLAVKDLRVMANDYLKLPDDGTLVDPYK